MSNLYSTLTSLCEGKGISPYRMCKDLGIQPSVMTDLKMGRRKTVKAATASKIAGYFEVPVSFLLEEPPFTDWETINSNRQKFVFDLGKAINLHGGYTEFMGISMNEPDTNSIPAFANFVDTFCKTVGVVRGDEGVQFLIETKATLGTQIQLGKQKKPSADAEGLRLDDFTYAMYNESKELTNDQKEALLEMARIFKKQREEKKG